MSEKFLHDLLALLTGPLDDVGESNGCLPFEKVEIVEDSISEASAIFDQLQAKYAGVTTVEIRDEISKYPLQSVADDWDIKLEDLKRWRYYIAIYEGAGGVLPDLWSGKNSTNKRDEERLSPLLSFWVLTGNGQV